MKRGMLLLGLSLALATAPVMADEYVNGYSRSDGTYVAPHFRSSPNAYQFDNYSSQGNTNPYTGTTGYGQHEFSMPSYSNPYDSGAGYDFGS